MRSKRGRVIWITGLSGAGKSTLAIALIKRLRKLGKPAVLLDGDDLRDIFGTTTSNLANHGTKARFAHGLQYARLGGLLARQGLTVVIATISMFRKLHAWNRAKLPGYFEVYLKVTLAELHRRDSKKIYSRFAHGKLANVAGLDLPVEEPKAPDIVLEFKTGQTARLNAELLMSKLGHRER